MVHETMPVRQMMETFGSGPVSVARAPGRVNLIGDHTDYNGGFVLPMAIDRDVRIAFRASDDARVELLSLQFEEKVTVELSTISPERLPGWARYVLGVAFVLREEGYRLRGLRGVVAGDIPIGAGLSSSAALEVASALAFCSVSGLQVNREKLARVCRRAEGAFVGVRCGIMDQFVSLMGRKGHALFLDCTTLNHELVPLEEKAAAFVVCDTGVRRNLADTPYEERRKESARAFKLLQRHVPELETYRTVSVAMFKCYAPDNLPEVPRKRARHVVTENERVLHAVRAMREGDLLTFGALMDASHDSLRDDYEVSCPELELMVGLARAVHGTFGTRMTGAGFGGCTVTLVRADGVEAFMKAVAAGYHEKTGRTPAIYVCRPSAGATVEARATYATLRSTKRATSQSGNGRES